jgi:FAD/FMN-containing dehydrogenase
VGGINQQLGLMKRDCLHYSKSDQAIRYMRVIKETFDPHFILNPYKVIPFPQA